MSVIIPVSNGAALLGPCLDAVLGQDLPRAAYEVLVVDNGSTDALATLIPRYPTVRWLVEPRRSAYAARNTGIRHALGSVLAFTDADCRPVPHWLLAALAGLAAGADAVAGRITHEIQEPANPWEWYSAWCFLSQETFVRHGWAVTANLVVSRPAFERVGPFFVDAIEGRADLSGDKQWSLRAAAQQVSLRYNAEAAVVHLTRKRFDEIVTRLRIVHRSTARFERCGGRRIFGVEVARRIWNGLRLLRRILTAAWSGRLSVRPAYLLVLSWPFLEAVKMAAFFRGWRCGSPAARRDG